MASHRASDLEKKMYQERENTQDRSCSFSFSLEMMYHHFGYMLLLVQSGRRNTQESKMESLTSSRDLSQAMQQAVKGTAAGRYRQDPRQLTPQN